MTRQIMTESMKRYLKQEYERTGECRWNGYINGVKYCHFLVDMCPIGRMDSQAEMIFEIPQRVFYRCKL